MGIFTADGRKKQYTYRRWEGAGEKFSKIRKLSKVEHVQCGHCTLCDVKTLTIVTVITDRLFVKTDL